MTKRFKLAAVAATCVATAAWAVHTVIADLTHVEMGEHASHLAWLPSEASDICYYKSYMMTAAEFRITEDQFRHWCSAEGYPLEPVSDLLSIRRYSWADAVKRERELATLPSTEQTRAEEEALTVRQYQKVMHGLYYRKDFGNGGGVTVAFDADQQMGFYESSPR